MKKDKTFFFRESCFFASIVCLLICLHYSYNVNLLWTRYYTNQSTLYFAVVSNILRSLAHQKSNYAISGCFFSWWLPLKIKSLHQTTQDIGKHCPRRILWVVDHHLFQVSKLIRCNGFVLEYLNVKKWHLRKWFSSRLKLGKIYFLCLWSCMRILTFAHSIDPLWDTWYASNHTAYVQQAQQHRNHCK